MNSDDIREPVDDRIPEPAELAHLAQLDGDLAVDEVEDVGDDHDDAGLGELAVRQPVSRHRVDDHADEGENVWVNPKLHARRDDRAKRERADAPDEAGEGHVAGIMNGSDVRWKRTV